ncbi:MAG: VWA domain-containing protein, partial [Planctomycetota bacterium]
VVSDRLAFVLDVSGSMQQPAGSRGRTTTRPDTGTTRLFMAKQELERALRGISPEVQFNLFFFGSRVPPWKEELVAKDEEVLEEALAYSRSRRSLGGTNIYDALMAAFADECVDTIYLLSDGDPSAGSVIDPSLIRTRIARFNRTRRVQIHCIAIGKPSPFLRQLALENGGAYAESL